MIDFLLQKELSMLATNWQNRPTTTRKFIVGEIDGSHVMDFTNLKLSLPLPYEKYLTTTARRGYVTIVLYMHRLMKIGL